MPDEKVTKISQDRQDRFIRFLPNSNDLTLIVLKGHLLIEEALNELIESTLPHTNTWGDCDFSFYQKICLARCLLGERFNDKLNAVESLNRLRNKLAHHLEHPEIENHILNFLKLIEASKSKKQPEPDFAKRLKLGISYLGGFLNGYIDATKNLKIQPANKKS